MNAAEITRMQEIATELKTLHRGGEGKRLADIIAALIEYAADQAKQIAYWRECYGDVVRRDMEEEGACRLALAAKDRQIATLKAALHKERNRYLVDFIHEYDDILDCGPEAKEQLARELPEIDWEDKQ